MDGPYLHGHLADVDAEQLFAQGCLMASDKVIPATAWLQISDLTDFAVRKVVQACRDLHKRGEPVTGPTVREATGEETEVVVAILRNAYADVSPDFVQQAITAARTLQRLSARRLGIDIGHELGAAANNGESPEGLVALMAEAQQEMIRRSDMGRKSSGLNGVLDDVFSMIDNPEPDHVVPHGFTPLYKGMPGFPRGQLTVGGGRPGMGKSVVAVSAALGAARGDFGPHDERTGKRKYGVMIFSLEMPKADVGARLLSAASSTRESPIMFGDILKRGGLDDRSRERINAAREKLRGLPIRIDDSRTVTSADIMGRAKAQQMAWENEGQTLDLLVVDYLQIIRASDRYTGSRYLEIGQISRDLATTAKELNVAVLAMAQVKRSADESSMPVLQDLRESGDIEQDAHTVFFPFRPTAHLEGKPRNTWTDSEAEKFEKHKNHMVFNFAKNRAGPKFSTTMYCDIGGNFINPLKG